MSVSAVYSEEIPEVLLEAHSTGFYRPTLVYMPADPPSIFELKSDSDQDTITTDNEFQKPDSTFFSSPIPSLRSLPDSKEQAKYIAAGKTFNDRLRFALEWSGYIKLEVREEETLTGPEEITGSDVFVTELHGEFLYENESIRAKLSLAVPDEEPFYTGSILFTESTAVAAGDASAEEILRQLTGMTPPFRSRIACVAKFKGDKKELVLLDYDGGNRQLLTRDKSIALSPSWSPDGKRIVFCSFRGGDDADLFIADLNEATITPLIKRSGTDAAPSWSPLGDWIVFAGSHGYSTDLYLVRSDGSDQTNLTLSNSINTSPSWSPTGRDIVFMSDRTGSPQLYRMDIDGLNLMRLTYEGNYNADPAWSATGDWIVYVRREKSGFQLRIMDPQGDVDIQLTDEPGDHLEPSWSPDGMRIAYSYKGKLWVMNADGTARRQLYAKGLMPDWSPISPLSEAGFTENFQEAGNIQSDE